MVRGMDLEILRQPAETREFEHGRFDVFHIGDRTFGLATYEPGWRWSEHVGRPAGRSECPVEHIGFVVSGSAALRMEDGEEVVMEAGDFFAIPPGHDSWVVGDRPYVSLHLLGAEDYARH
jgi:quercetin dioxygenase-like cupin family protein